MVPVVVRKGVFLERVENRFSESFFATVCVKSEQTFDSVPLVVDRVFESISSEIFEPEMKKKMKT